MSQLQYIGARYVPVWYENSLDQSANWESNVEYEPLTFVTSANNHLYLSKKTVPDNIGTPASNVAYWLDMGVFTNAQIAQLQQEVDDMKDGTVSGSLQNQINNMNDGSVAGSLQSQINDLSRHNKRKFIFIGDSYGTTSTGVTTTWIDVTVNALGLSASDYYERAEGGASWEGVSPRKSFLTLLQELENTVTDKDFITDIVVGGGVNDNISTIIAGLAGVAAFCTYVKANYPNAIVRPALIGWGRDRTLRENINNISYPIYTTSGYRGCAPLNLMYPILHNYEDDFLTDDVHPTLQGQQKIGWCVASALNGGIGNYCNPFITTMATDNSVFSDSFTMKIRKSFDNSYQFTLYRQTVHPLSNTFVGWDTIFDMGAATGYKDFSPLDTSVPLANLSCLIGWSDGGTTKMTPATMCLYIINGHLYGRFCGDTTLSVTNVSLIFFPGDSFTVSSYMF